MVKFRHGTLRVLTANDLLTGDVVFLTAQGNWSRDLGEARLAGTQDEAEALEVMATSAEAEAVTAAAYTIDVERSAGGRVRPVRKREIIRITGPLALQVRGAKAPSPTQVQVRTPELSVPPTAQNQPWLRPGNGDDHVSL